MWPTTVCSADVRSNTELEAAHERRTADARLAAAEAEAVARQQALEQELVAQHELLAKLQAEVQEATDANGDLSGQSAALEEEARSLDESETRLAAVLVEVAAASSRAAEVQEQIDAAAASKQEQLDRESDAAARRKELEAELDAASQEEAAVVQSLDVHHEYV